MITERLAELVRSALASAAADGLLDGDPLPEPEFERPRNKEHGDWATNVALIAAQGGRKPREVAAAIVDRLPASDVVADVQVAGPGFLNFRLAPSWLHDVVRRAADPSSGFGRSTLGEGTKVNVEYISANPVGPMTVVTGRHAAVGDTVANLLETVGFDVTREYYVNDTGRQIDLFAQTVEAHYLSHLGRPTDVPDEGYHGEYVIDVARDIATQIGDSLLGVAVPERRERLARLALENMKASIQATLDRFGTRFDVWFWESTLHERDEVNAAISRARERGFIEEREDAVWFLSSQLGDDKDRVVIRANGAPTYSAADMAYLVDKFGRGFDHLIYLWGADHHGTVPRLLAAAEALGFDRTRVEVRLMQIVNLLRSGEVVRASTRAGVLFPLDDLIDEVGVDASRYTFLTRSIDQRLDFDIDLVKQQAPENPVYYVQYAHARISSILRKAGEGGVTADPATAPLEVLGHPSEDELMRKLAAFEEEVIEAALRRAPQRVTRYVEELASTFSAFYRDCKVISDDARTTAARLSLCIATRGVIARGLGLLGVAAPERM